MNEQRRFLAIQNEREDGERYHLEPAVDYDVAADIDAQNGWTEPGEKTETHNSEVFERASQLTTEILRFTFARPLKDARSISEALRKFVAVAWLIRSDLILNVGGKPMSLRELGQALGCTRSRLSDIAQEFGAKWGFHSRSQKRPSASASYSEAAKRAWEKRRNLQKAA